MTVMTGGSSVNAWLCRVSCRVQTRRKKERTAAPAKPNKGTENETLTMTSKSLGFGGSGKRAQEIWQCVTGCGACCKLDKGPAFPSPEEIFTDDPTHVQLYKSMIGPDGWCIHYEHATRTCSIYPDRPYFCRVEAEVFDKLYGISGRNFNKEACRSSKDTIAAVYGAGSEELKNFNCTLRNNRVAENQIAN